MRRRRIAIVTTTRAEYGLLRHTIRAIVADRRADLRLVVGGQHLEPRFGSTVSEILADGVPVAARVPLPLRGDRGIDAAEAMGAAVAGFGRAFGRLRPEIVLVLGDRYEILAAAEAAILVGTFLAHLNGGEVTAGSLDEGWRHAITKLAHLHLPATREFAARIRAMGEPAWRIHVVGSPGVEAVRLGERVPRATLAKILGHELVSPLVICTYHPVTNDQQATERECAAIIGALRRSPAATIVITAPNADAGGRAVADRLRRFAREDRRATYIASLGSARYLSLLRIADAMVGNSSSGLIEAPAFRLPVVNVGPRQDGRPRARNVIHAEGSAASISRALERALRPAFRRSLRALRSPYGSGRVSERVRQILLTVPLDGRLRSKRFEDPR